jgi:hypothetical protein
MASDIKNIIINVDDNGCRLRFKSISKGKKPRAFKNDILRSSYTENMSQLKKFGFDNCNPYLTCGLVKSVINAYNDHLAVKFGPDDVWIAIVYAFAHHIGTHPKSYRKYFVDHEDKKEIIVQIGESLEQVIQEDDLFDACIQTFVDKIKSNIKDADFVDWVTTDFSTSTPLDHVVKNIGLMASVKNYFNFNLMSMCGLPKVRLCGKKDDWIKIREKITYLQKFSKIGGIGSWINLLEYVIDHFVSAFDGIADFDFWQNVRSNPSKSGEPIKVTGWILAFSPFDHQGESFLATNLQNAIQTQNFSCCCVEPSDLIECGAVVPFKHVDFSGKETQLYIHGGGLSYRYNKGHYETVNGWRLLKK